MVLSILSILSGMTLIAGIIQLVMGWNKPDRTKYLAFFALSMFTTTFLILHSIIYYIDDMTAFILISKLDMLMIALIGISLTWFIAYYLDELNIWALTSVTTSCSMVIIVNLLSANSIMYGDVYGLKHVILPWGEAIHLPDASISSWHILLDVTYLFVAIYIIYALIRLYRRGKKLLAAFWGFFLILILLAAMHDYAVISGFINSLYLLEYTLVVFVIVMCIQLIMDLIKSSQVRKSVIMSERKLRTLFEQVDLIVVGLNRMGNIDYVNPYFFEITGFEPDEIIGKDWFFTVLPKDETYQVQSAFLEILKNDFHPAYQNSIVKKDGGQIPIAWYNVRLQDDNGRIMGSMSIGVDISTIKTKE